MDFGGGRWRGPLMQNVAAVQGLEFKVRGPNMQSYPKVKDPLCSMNTYTHTCTYTLVIYPYMCICKRLCKYVCTYIYVYIHIYIDIHTLVLQIYVYMYEMRLRLSAARR